MPHIELVEPTILLILDSYILNTASLRDIVETTTNGLVAKQHDLMVVLPWILV